MGIFVLTLLLEYESIFNSGVQRQRNNSNYFEVCTSFVGTYQIETTKKSEKNPKKIYLPQICTNNTNMEYHVTDLTIYGNMTSYMIQNRNFELNAKVTVTCDRSNYIW